ncbi:SCO6880 family protein [Microlunatus sp. GCM10028923]|uniref:SCO6880 family protein n=1 Tax=Microlunatus sp. GCM10028923 TaxID=3273400 RepID=UPI00361379D9
MTTSQDQLRDAVGPRPVKFSRLSRRGVLLGLSISRLSVLSLGGLALVGALYAGGGMLIIYTAPLSLLSAALACVPIAGRTAIDWVPVAAQWVSRLMHDQLRYRRKIVRPRPAGTLALPGEVSRLREYTDPDTGAVMVHDPHEGTLTVILEVSHPAFVLLDPGDQERRIAAWGRVLATVCRSGRIAAVQVLERTLPDSGSGLAEWWIRHGVQDGSWPAELYADLIERAGPAGERHATTLSLSLDLHACARQIRTAGRGLRGASGVLRQEMTTLVAALRAADLTPSNWYTAGQLAVLLRGAYDPAIAPALERHRGLGQELATAGPVAVVESWDRLRTDSAFHAVLWISEWPRSLVYPGFLAPILLSSGVQRSFSLLCTPLRTDQAARDIRKKKVEHLSDAAQRAKIGQVDDAAQTAELGDVLQQEADLTAGHGILRYTGLISVSAPTSDQLDVAVAAIEQAAIQASCETRRLVGQQAQAFNAAALPLCRKL